MRLSALPLFFLSFSSLIAQDTTGVGSLVGVVLDDGGSRAPVPGARVCVAGMDRCVTSASPGGAFRLNDLRAGTYTISVETPDGRKVSREGVEVRNGLLAEVEFLIPPVGRQSQEITVSAPVFVAAEEIKNSNYLVTAQEVLKTAGSLQDVSRYIQTLPGVVTGNFDFRNDIIVRGGSPLENLFIVDNIEIPNINNFANFASAGGPVSMIDAELLQDVNFYSGGYPSPYVNRLSSVMQMNLREGSRDRFRKKVTLGYSGGGAIFEGPMKEKGSWVISARRSFLDAFTDDIGFGGVPVNYSFNAKALYDINPRNRIWVINVSGLDNIGIRPDPKDPDEDLIFNINYDGWRSATGFNWQRLIGSRGVALLGFSHSEARVNQNVEDTLLGGAQVYRENSREGESTVKGDFTFTSGGIGKLQAGAAYKYFNVDYRAAQPLGNQNPFLEANQRVNAFDFVRGINAAQGSGYVQNTRDFGRLNVTAGARTDYFSVLKSTRVSPRAGVSFRINNRLSWRASWGIYFQQPSFFFVAAYPQNRALIPSRAQHRVTGLAWQPTDSTRVTVEVYEKLYADYPVSLEYPQLSLANAGDTFAVRNLLFPLTSAGRGRARGVEFFAEKKLTRKLYGQANIAFSRARHAGLDGVLRPGAFDSPRVFNFTGGYVISSKWEAAARFVYYAGRPYTPFNEALSVEQRRGVFDLARVNALRAPAYIRTDFRVDRKFETRWGPLNLFFGLQNAFGRKNFFGPQWNQVSNRSQIQEQFGRFPIIGFDWRL